MGGSNLKPFDESLKRAIILIRNFRVLCLNYDLDPRATRIALKFGLYSDTVASKGHISPEDEETTEKVARDLLRQVEQKNRLKQADGRVLL